MCTEHALKGIGIIRREKRDNSSAHVDEEPDRLSGTLRIEVRPMPEVPGAPDPALPSKGGHGEALQRANRRIRNRLGAPGEVVPTDSHRAVIALDPTVLVFAHASIWSRVRRSAAGKSFGNVRGRSRRSVETDRGAPVCPSRTALQWPPPRGRLTRGGVGPTGPAGGAPSDRGSFRSC